jgi:hypothetical protein
MCEGGLVMGDLGIGGTTCNAEAAVERGDLLQLGTAWPQVIKTAADTDKVVGIALSAAAAGEAVLVAFVRGVYMCRSSAAISKEDRIAPAADGEIKTAAAADESCGMALEAATAADQDVRCLLFTADHLVA